MEELYQNKVFQEKQLKVHSPINESSYSSKLESVLQQIQKHNKNQDYSKFSYSYMHQKLLVPVEKLNFEKRKENMNILKLDTKTKTNCVKISLNNMKKAFKNQGVSRQNVLQEKKQEKCCPNIQYRSLKKDVKNLSDLCILAQGRKATLLKFQQKLKQTKYRKKQNSSFRLHTTSRLFSQKQKQNNKSKQQFYNHKKNEFGYEKRIIRVKTHENLIRQMFSRYDCFKNDKKDINGVVDRIKSSLNKKINLLDYF